MKFIERCWARWQSAASCAALLTLAGWVGAATAEDACPQAQKRACQNCPAPEGLLPILSQVPYVSELFAASEHCDAACETACPAAQCDEGRGVLTVGVGLEGLPLPGLLGVVPWPQTATVSVCATTKEVQCDGTAKGQARCAVGPSTGPQATSCAVTCAKADKAQCSVATTAAEGCAVASKSQCCAVASKSQCCAVASKSQCCATSDKSQCCATSDKSQCCAIATTAPCGAKTTCQTARTDSASSKSAVCEAVRACPALSTATWVSETSPAACDQAAGGACPAGNCCPCDNVTSSPAQGAPTCPVFAGEGLTHAHLLEAVAGFFHERDQLKNELFEAVLVNARLESELQWLTEREHLREDARQAHLEVQRLQAQVDAMAHDAALQRENLELALENERLKAELRIAHRAEDTNASGPRAARAPRIPSVR